ncbi:MAG TPA: site-2 protease family protein [Firmicutes bacterium]|jgi:Zn-dependent protease|nr:site-2 protease family protein [Bacillota bacterium]
MNDIADIILSIPVFLLAISFHEYAHAYTAVRLGDPTPERQGRLTLNFMSHISLPGILTLLLAGIGWAKPVQVMPQNFRNPNTGMLLVSVAGPAANLALAVIFGLLFKVAVPILLRLDATYQDPLIMLLLIGVQLNLMLAVFNLFPIPPLDGSKILLTLLPGRLAAVYAALEPYGFLVLFLLLRFGGLGSVLYTLTFQGMRLLL